MHPFIERLGLRVPILQAPMAGVSTPALAAAVTQAGGLGALGLGAMTVDQAEAALRAAAALTTGPINANLFCHQPVPPDPARNRAWIAHLAPAFAEFMRSQFPMAVHLLDAGYSLTVWGRRPASTEPLAEMGAATSRGTSPSARR